jgi:hypothetical protein
MVLPQTRIFEHFFGLALAVRQPLSSIWERASWTAALVCSLVAFEDGVGLAFAPPVIHCCCFLVSPVGDLGEEVEDEPGLQRIF